MKAWPDQPATATTTVDVISPLGVHEHTLNIDAMAP